MAGNMTGQAMTARRLDDVLRLLMWSGLLALWLLPMIAKQFTDEVQWTTMDHIAWFFLLAVPGVLLEIVSRLTTDWFYRIGFALALATAFVITWANLAVGIVGDEDNRINLLFYLVVALPLIGAPAVGFRPRRMAMLLTLTAAAQALTALTALGAEPFVLVFCGATTGLWLVSARLFDRAARNEAAA